MVVTERSISDKHIDQLLTVREAAKVLNVSLDTIRRWEKKGLIKAERTVHNYRVFCLDELKRAERKYSGGSDGTKFRLLKGRKTHHTVIEVFSGCGGMALGLENAGLKPVMMVEVDRDCVATLKQSRPKWNVVQDYIENIDFTSYRRTVDVVAGGFPCQAFSYAGNGKGFDDTRGTLFFQFARCVREVEPKLAIAENVRGLVRHDGGKTLATMLNVLDELGYYVDYQLLRAQFLDVPQKRERVFIIGIRKDLETKFIYPREQDYTISLRQTLQDCPISAGASYPYWKRQVMEHVPPGGYWRDLPIDLQKKYMKGSFNQPGGKTGMARRLSWNEPSLTLTCNPAQKHTERCHPNQTRPLTVREYARLQTFPDTWQFAGSVASQYRQIGNALPVNLAYHIGKCLIAMLDERYDSQDIIVRSPRELAFQQPITLAD